jgi:hypothetical protein
MSTQGFLDLTEVDTPPDSVDEPNVNDVISAVKPIVSNRPENVMFGTTPINAGQCIQLVSADPSRSRVGVGVAAPASGTTTTTLAYVSDRALDGFRVGGLAYVEGAQLPIVNSGSDYLELQTTSDIWVTVPASATNPVLISFYTESYSAS